MSEKEWYLSKGVWGGVVAALAGILALFGKPLAPELQGTIVDTIIAVIGAAGGVTAVYGRLKATSVIK